MKSALQALKLLFDYAVHTLITMLAFSTLIAATCVIHETAKHLEGDFFQMICKWLEAGLFIVGVLVLAAMTLFLTIVFLIDLLKNFRGLNSTNPPEP